MTTALIAQALIQKKSITPHEGGALSYLKTLLEEMGFQVTVLVFEEDGTDPVHNLYARYGAARPYLLFAGHTDVVEPGPREAWRTDPFEGVIKDDVLYGRGAVDMKGSIAAFINAVQEVMKTPFQGSLGFLITGDEEGIAINGTQKALKWMEEKGEVFDYCLVGEPTCKAQVGDTLKIGRKGSLNGVLTCEGIQGHVACPEAYKNPISALIAALREIEKGPSEPVSSYFKKTHISITSIDVGNQTVNVVPQKAVGRFNIRFSDQQTGASLKAWLEKICQEKAGAYTLECAVSGEADVLEPGHLTTVLSAAVEKVTGCIPALSTEGGTSDARFIRFYGPVIEFGLLMETMHQINECVSLKDLETLTAIYKTFIEDLLGETGKP